MTAIRLKGVNVDFPIYDGRARSLRNRIFSKFKSERIQLEHAGRVVVHALIDIDLDFKPGDRVGIIGRNGSGKSTLLRVLAGIYHPSSGTAEIEGSVAAPLDMLLGIAMESTGYENMLLRGLALGMTKAEVEAVAEDVGTFSGLGGHLHLPAQTYSSGMLLRLAFAISTAHTREILLIDEVIGAGDAEFIGRARARLNGLAERSSIVVVASHNADALKEMCTDGLVLDGGHIRFRGPIADALSYYNEEVNPRRPKAPAVASPPPQGTPVALSAPAASSPQASAAEEPRKSGTTG